MGLIQSIYRPCRDDNLIYHILAAEKFNAEHQTRWKKEKLDGNFCWPGCNTPSFVSTQIATAAQLQALASKNECTQQCFPVPTPLNRLGNSTIRQCPDPQHYLAEHTEFEERLSEESASHAIDLS